VQLLDLQETFIYRVHENAAIVEVIRNVPCEKFFSRSTFGIVTIITSDDFSFREMVGKRNAKISIVIL
jgi:hypothetical protein